MDINSSRTTQVIRDEFYFGCRSAYSRAAARRHDPRWNGGSAGFYGAFKFFYRGSTDFCGGSVWSMPRRATFAS